MLNFILGKSGTGKSKYIFDKINELVSRTDINIKILLVVPEQVSFNRETHIFNFIKNKYISRVEVISFKWLAYQILREYGGIAYNYADNIIKHITMVKAIKEIGPELEFYKKSLGKEGFVKELLALTDQFRTNLIYNSEIMELLKEINHDSLKKKLLELSKIYNMYITMLSQKYKHPMDYINFALDKLKYNNFFNNKVVFFDEFDRFTDSEYAFITKIIDQSENTYFALRISKNQIGNSEINSNFILDTFNRLKLIAKKIRVDVSVPVYLSKCVRYNSKALEFLNDNYFELESKEFLDNNSSDIKIYSAIDKYDEITYVAGQVNKLIREQNYKYNDFVIIVRNLSEYREEIKNIFSKYEIPLFIDDNYDIQYNPIIRFILYFLDSVKEKYSTISIICLLKSQLLDLDMSLVFKLEQYVYMWSLDGDQWDNDFTFNPSGLKLEPNEKETLLLDQLNSLRKYIINMLNKYKQETSLKTGNVYVKYLYKAILDLKINSYIEQAVNNVNIDQREIYLKSYDAVIKIFDLLYDTIGDQTLSIHEFKDYFNIAVKNYNLDKIPQIDNSVTVLHPNKDVYNNHKVSFVLSMNQDVFPACPNGNTLITDCENRILINMGFNLNDSINDLISRENISVYKAVTSASNKLYITYPRYSSLNQLLYPSSVISKIISIFGKNILLSKSQVRISDFICSKSILYEWACLQYNDNSTLSASLVDSIKTFPNFYQKLNLLVDNKLLTINKIANKDISKNLFVQNMVLSPTRIELYHRCKFKYFCRYGLKVRRMQIADFNPIETGTFLHYILYQITSKYREKLPIISISELKCDVKELFKQYLSNLTGGYNNLSSKFNWFYNNLFNNVLKILVHLQKEMAQSMFRPSDFELDIGFRGDIRPLLIPTKYGSVAIHGKVDRVDVLLHKNKRYLRVIDYKSGNNKFNFAGVYYGVNLQMLLYLFAIIENGEGVYKNISPAGIFYMPIGEPKIQLDRYEGQPKVIKSQLEQFRMNGLFINNLEILDSMDKGISNTFVNAKLNKNGALNNKCNVISEKDLYTLRDYTYKMIENMIDSMHSGDISPHSLSNDVNSNYCRFCEYKSVCGNIETEIFEVIKDVNLEDFLGNNSKDLEKGDLKFE